MFCAKARPVRPVPAISLKSQPPFVEPRRALNGSIDAPREQHQWSRLGMTPKRLSSPGRGSNRLLVLSCLQQQANKQPRRRFGIDCAPSDPCNHRVKSRNKRAPNKGTRQETHGTVCQNGGCVVSFEGCQHGGDSIPFQRYKSRLYSEWLQELLDMRHVVRKALRGQTCECKITQALWWYLL